MGRLCYFRKENGTCGMVNPVPKNSPLLKADDGKCLASTSQTANACVEEAARRAKRFHGSKYVLPRETVDYYVDLV